MIKGFTAHHDDNLYDFDTNLETILPGTALGGGFSKPMTSALRAPGTSARPLMSSMGKNVPMSRGGVSRMGAGDNSSSEARPMTSVSGAGYRGTTNDPSKVFDPFNIGRGPAPPLANKADNGPEDKAKEMEKGVHKLIEASAQAISSHDYQKGLEKAKEAGKAERALSKFRESNNLTDHINYDLTYAICFNLANAFYHNKMYEESLNTYQLIVKNKNYPQSGRLRVNMGNIYYEQKKYTHAIKMYRMALDQIPATGKELKLKITRNIGNSFVKLGQFQDAIDSYETVMNGTPDIQTAFNLMLCYYARGDKDKMKKHFSKMLGISIVGMTEDDMERLNGVLEMESSTDILTEKEDSLREELSRRKEIFQEKILTAARLIAPVVDEKEDWLSGYQWVMEQLKPDHEVISSKLEIDLAMEYLKKRQFEESIDVLKGFEKKDPTLKAMASTNLSFIYYLEGDYSQAEKQADLAIRSDRYNAKALVNKGNCLFVARDYQRAREMYLEAVGVEADCIEAIYNLGLVNLELSAIEEGKNAFDKLHTILPTAPEALFQLASIYERQNLEEAAKTYERLLTRVPGDPNICSRLGQVYEKMDDENTACHWHSEAHRFFPVNLNVISWLGVWYVKREMYEQAIEYFERAVAVQPGEVKWRLMVTSCYRRLGDFHKALELYQKIHEEFPENVEALQYLEALCKDLGRPHDEYSKQLEKLRRSQPQPSQTTTRPPATNNAAATAAAAPQAPQRSERPRPERSDRPERSERPMMTETTSQKNRFDEPDTSSRAPMAAPRAGGNPRDGSIPAPANNRPSKMDDDDEFGGTDVGSLLI